MYSNWYVYGCKRTAYINKIIMQIFFVITLNDGTTSLSNFDKDQALSVPRSLLDTMTKGNSCLLQGNENSVSCYGIDTQLDHYQVVERC